MYTRSHGVYAVPIFYVMFDQLGTVYMYVDVRVGDVWPPVPNVLPIYDTLGIFYGANRLCVPCPIAKGRLYEYSRVIEEYMPYYD